VKICVASNLSPKYQGGLAAYERTLIKLLTAHPSVCLDVIYAAEPDPGQFPTAEAAADFSGTRIKERSLPAYFSSVRSRLATRPFTRPVLKSVLAATWQFPRELRPDVLHFVGTGWDFFGFGLANLSKKRNSLLTIWPAIHPRSWGDHEIDLSLYRQADVVLCQSEHERDHLERLGLPKARSMKCPLPPMCRADGQGDRFREKYKLADQPTVLFLGRRHRSKGYLSMLEAWPMVRSSIPDAVLILAGPGGGEFQEQLRDLPQESVCNLSMPDELEKADALAACDIFCLPSAHESFGIVYVEAWSYGKPVICGPAPASREFIKDGHTGLWSSQEADDLAAKILSLLQDTKLRAAMGAAGLALQKDQFNEQTFLRTHLQAFGSEMRFSDGKQDLLAVTMDEESRSPT
jgi:glycosyltransferase involved in cell wall biosynthesis